MKLAKILTLNPIALLEQLVLVFTKSEIVPTMNAHEFTNYELEFNQNNPQIPTKEEKVGMLDERDDATNNELLQCLS